MNEASRRRWLPVLAAAAMALFVLGLGGLMTELGPWYENLRKPAWQPPGWLFGPVWTLIYALTALAAVKAWRAAGTRRDRDWLLALFAINGFLNVFWSLLFFRLQRPDWALVEVAFLWLSIVALIIATGRHDRTAGRLLWPYLAWVSFAAFLNFTIVQLNGPF